MVAPQTRASDSRPDLSADPATATAGTRACSEPLKRARMGLFLLGRRTGRPREHVPVRRAPRLAGWRRALASSTGQQRPSGDHLRRSCQPRPVKSRPKASLAIINQKIASTDANEGRRRTRHGRGDGQRGQWFARACACKRKVAHRSVHTPAARSVRDEVGRDRQGDACFEQRVTAML